MSVEIINADVMEGLPRLGDESVNCVATSPPYWALRDYGTATWDGGQAECDHTPTKRPEQKFYNGRGQLGNSCTSWTTRWGKTFGLLCPRCGARRIDRQIGLEATPDEYLDRMVEVFREVRRVLRRDGTCWVNMGDCYASGDRATYSSGRSDNRGHQVQDNMPRPKTLPGLKPKDLVGIPWRVAFALQADGWWLRSDIIWHKPNPMPESVQDRPTRAHEYVFLLTRSERYWYDAEAIREAGALDTMARYRRGRSNHHKWADGGPGNQTIAKSLKHMVGGRDGTDTGDFGSTLTGGGWGRHHLEDALPETERRPVRDKQPGHSRRHAGFNDRWDRMTKQEQCRGARNKRDVWTIGTAGFGEAHFATFPPALVAPMILAGCPEGGVVLDPFGGSGTVGLVAQSLGRRAVLIELNPEYCEMARRRCAQGMLW